MAINNACRVATAQYPIGFFRQWSEYVEKIQQWVTEAVNEGATLLVFPEYFSLELASLLGPSVYRDLKGQLQALQPLYPDFCALFQALAVEHQVMIVAGTFPVDTGSGVYVNRANVFRANGTADYQDKIQMTRFEAEQWGVSASVEVKTLSSELGPFGIIICYDSEFPLIARAQVELGARFLIAPTCTEALAGYYRVRIGSQARALENQCYVVQASLVGQASWSAAVDSNTGAAAVYTPVDRGFPDDGVLAIGVLNQPQWVFADIDLAKIDRVRTAGQVLNYRDWDHQYFIQAVKSS